MLAEEWKFASNYANTIRYHHNLGGVRRHRRLVYIVHMADAVCRQLEFGSGGDEEKPEIDEVALNQFSLREKGVQLLVEAAEQDLQDADSFLSALSN